MTTYPSYSIRFTATDKACLRELAQQLERSQASTLRLLLRESLKALKAADTHDNEWNKRMTTNGNE